MSEDKKEPAVDKEMEAEVARLLGMNLPDMASTLRMAKVLDKLTAKCNELYGEEDKEKEDPNAPYYKYLISAMVTFTTRTGHLDTERLHTLLVLAFAIGRMRESNIKALQELKADILKELGPMTEKSIREALSAKKDTSLLQERLKEALEGSGLEGRVMAINLSDLLRMRD